MARSYVGNDGYEVRVAQGYDRLEIMAKIKQDCPEFLIANNVPDNYWPKVFAQKKSVTRSKPVVMKINGENINF